MEAVFGDNNLKKAWIIVDFPEPDSPMMPRLSPADSSKDTSSIA